LPEQPEQGARARGHAQAVNEPCARRAAKGEADAPVDIGESDGFAGVLCDHRGEPFRKDPARTGGSSAKELAHGHGNPHRAPCPWQINARAAVVSVDLR